MSDLPGNRKAMAIWDCGARFYMEPTGRTAGQPEMTLTSKIAWDDTVLPFQLDHSDIRGRVARLDQTLNRLLAQHNYPPEVAAMVAEAALLTALIGQTIKLRWKLSLQVRGSGPLPTMRVSRPARRIRVFSSCSMNSGWPSSMISTAFLPRQKSVTSSGISG